ncbi:nitroreductase family protein [Marinococcus luteus]|uniref:nitroreductase family protein n=1 Tax=Marinococcus luteus TaxID=1122204 RepID=UPI002ACCD256|nr:nitroreductase [Marinococcus luteus]MDZ5782014.1 nitroreductase [Marinococcus luteus]
MDVLTAIHSRRSNGLVEQTEVPEDAIAQVLEAGTWAPSHHKTEPWRYFVMTGDGRKQLGEAMAAIVAEGMTPEEKMEKQKNLEKQKEKPMRAPVVIAVAAEPSEEERVDTLEEYGAVYASIQNMLLAAHALGLAAFWRTGAHCYHPKMNELFGLGWQGKVLGLIYIGYPMREMKEGHRKPVEQVTTWIRE